MTARDLIKPRISFDQTEVKENLEIKTKLLNVCQVLKDNIEHLKAKNMPVFKYENILQSARSRALEIEADLTGISVAEVMAEHE